MIDASIPLGAKGIQIESPVNQLATLLQIQGAQQSNQLNGMKMDEYRRGVTEDQQMRDLTRQSGGDTSKLRDLLYGAGNYKQGAAMDKAIAEQRKSAADMDKTNMETAAHRLDLAGQVFGHVRANPTLETANAALDYLGQNGIYQPEQVAQYKAKVAADPQNIAQMADVAFRAALKAKEQLPAYQTRNTGGTTDTLSIDPVTGRTAVTNSVQNTQSPDSIASNATQRRGQNMTDARALETARSQIVQTDNGPVLVNMQTGSGTVVNGPDGNPLPGISKPLNDNQSKALLFGSRMREADKILGQLASEGTETSVPGSRASIIGGAISAMSSGNKQMLDQAKRDFMTAVLRRESGAAISTGEFTTADQQYFPQIGDSAKVVAQKARNRDLAIQGILAEVPEKQRNSLQPRNPAPAAASNIDALLNKYK